MADMFRRSGWLLPALVLLASVPSSAVQRSAVGGPDVPDVIVRPIKSVKASVEAVDSPAAIVKAVKTVKPAVGKVMADIVSSRLGSPF
jgi:hypothetical protein